MTNISTLGNALAQIERLKDQQSSFSMLSVQLATGKKTQSFTGLQTDILVSKRSRADFSSLQSYIDNITNADRRIKLMLTAIEEFQAQAKNFLGALVGLSQESVHQEGEIVYWDDPTTPDVVEQIPLGHDSAQADIDFRTMQDLANNISDFLIDLVNAQDADRYLLGGSETLTPPLNDTGTLDSAISNMINSWKAGTITNDELVANIQDRTTADGNSDALTDSIIGYNSALSSGNTKDIFIRVSEVSEIEYTMLANEQAFRDMIVAVSYFKNAALPPIADEVEIDPGTGLPNVLTEGAPGATTDEMKDNFFAVFNDLKAMVDKAVDDIDQLRFKLENTRARLDQIKQSHVNQQNLLKSNIADVEDVDINEVAVRLNTLQIQLEASFRVAARLQELSLVNFI